METAQERGQSQARDGQGPIATELGVPFDSIRSLDGLEAQLAALGFEANRNALYHQARRGFHFSLHRTTMWLVIAASAATTIAVAQSETTWAHTFALAPALLVGADMALGCAHRALQHGLLARRSLDLAGIIEQATPTDGAVRRCRAAFYALITEDAGEYRAVNAVCFNQLLQRIGHDPGRELVVPPTARWLRHWIRFETTDFAPRREAMASASGVVLPSATPAS